MRENRNLFRLTRFFLLRIPVLLKILSKFRLPQKRLLIIKTDAIGDYILFRNFIETVKKSEAYKDYDVDLLGNSVWESIALTYDAEFIENFFFTAPNNLYHSPAEVLKLGYQLYKRNYQVVFQPSFARTFMEAGLAGFTAASQIIGFETNTERIQARYKKKTDRFYTELLILPSPITFEFERTHFFFEMVLKQPVNVREPTINVNKIDSNSIVIFPGAGVSKRGWEISNFLELIKLIKNHCLLTVYVCGGPSEAAIADYFTKNLPEGSIINLVNKTTLPQLIQLIGSAKFVVTNETSAIHIAAATKTKAVCILGGGHFGRFAPYPEYIVNSPVCIFTPMECYGCNWNCKFNVPDNSQYPCISNVSVSAVWSAILPLLPA